LVTFVVGIDILINNAAQYDNGSLEMIDINDYLNGMKVNLVSPMAITKACLPKIREAKGSVIFISSAVGNSSDFLCIFLDLPRVIIMLGTKALPGTIIYSSGKAALNMAAKVLALDEASNGVRVNVVAPGTVVTDMFRNFSGADAA